MQSKILILLGALLAASAAQESQVEAMTMPAGIRLARRAATHTTTKTVTHTVTASGACSAGPSKASSSSSSSTRRASSSSSSSTRRASSSSTTKAPTGTKASASSSATSTAAAAASTGKVTYAPEVLSYHNQKRALHNTPALTWSDDLAKYAGNYGSKCQFKHSGGAYGENLAAGAPVDYWTSEALFDLWYAEGDNYNYNYNAFNQSTGHFTQLLWKSSTQLGCAVVTCNADTLGFQTDAVTDAAFLICEYSQAGNIAGQYTTNVLPLK